MFISYFSCIILNYCDYYNNGLVWSLSYLGKVYGFNPPKYILTVINT